MARIAEDLLLLLLDNASGRPALGHSRREKLLGAAVLLDLAFACRVWLSYDGAPAPAGRLLPSGEPDLADPILDPPLRMMHQHVWRPRTAVAKLSRGVEPALLGRLEQGGHIRPVQMQGQPLTGSVIWPMVDRTRVDEVRAGLVSALFDLNSPAPTTAAIISLLYPVGALTEILSLHERGRRWVDSRAGDIAGGCWLDESTRDAPHVNLAVVASAVRPALT